MTRSTVIRKGGIIFLPISTTYPKYKVTINGTDVSAYVIFCETIGTATDRIPFAHLTIDNYKGRYNSEWDAGDIIKVYSDYATSSNFTTHVPTNQIFEGKLDYALPGLSSNGHIMEVRGRTAPELADNGGIIGFDGDTIDVAIKAVIDDCNAKLGYDVITYTTKSIQATSVTVSANYRGQSYISILADLCRRAGFDSRINIGGVFEAFTIGSKVCYRESIASGVNLMVCPPCGKDSTRIRNFIQVYGPEKEGTLIMATKKASIFTPWRKELDVNDTANENRLQCLDRANKEYDNLHDTEIEASPICVGMPFLKEGDYIRAFIEYTEVNGWYVAKQITHTYSMSGTETKVLLSELEKDGLKLIKNNARDIREKSTFNNPNSMEQSYHFTFENDNNVDSHSNTETDEGKLKLITGNDTGIMTSDALTVDDTATKAEVRFNGNDDCDLCTFEVSFDNVNYKTITPGTKGEPGEQLTITNTGKKIRLRINMKSSTALSNPNIESAVVLFK